MRKFLTLEFWDEMKQLFPKQMNLFLPWINEYKKSNDWDQLFNEHEETGIVKLKYEAPKYHDLPEAMQIGIFLQFVAEINQWETQEIGLHIIKSFRDPAKMIQDFLNFHVYDLMERIKGMNKDELLGYMMNRGYCLEAVQHIQEDGSMQMRWVKADNVK